MLVLDVLSSAGTFGALCAAIVQLRKGVLDHRVRDEERRIERSIAMFDEVVAGGPTAEAFHRLSVALRGHGSQQAKISTWHRLADSDLENGRFLEAIDERRDRLFADLYTVLWFFERVETSLEYKIVNRDVLMKTLGFHFWWWGEVLHDLHAPKAARSLHNLAMDVVMWARNSGDLKTWCNSCATDFNGKGPHRCR